MLGSIPGRECDAYGDYGAHERANDADGGGDECDLQTVHDSDVYTRSLNCHCIGLGDTLSLSLGKPALGNEQAPPPRDV